MAVLLTAVKNRVQPQQVAVLDRSNPLTAGLSMVQVMGVTRQHDAVSNKISVAVGGKTVNSAGGRATGFGGTLGVGSTDKVATPMALALSKRTYLYIGVRNGTGGGALGRLGDKTNSTTGQFTYWSGSNSAITYGYYAGSAEQAVELTGSGTTAAAGVPFVAMITHDVTGTTHTVNAFMGGAQIVTNNVVVGASNDAAATVLTIGNRASDNARNWDGTILLAATWERILSQAEIAAISVNPWQLFQGQPRRLWAASSGGASYALTCADGAYSMTGASAAMVAAHRVTAAQGVYTITGNPAALRDGHILTAAPGAYSFTGNAANLVYVPPGVVLPAAGGSYAYTGNAVTMRAAHRLVAEAGGYTLTGNAVANPMEQPLKVGGDDVPRDDEERIEIWERPAKTPKRDDSLDKVIREAYAKATGKAQPAKEAAPKPEVKPAFDFEEDDIEFLLLTS